MHALGFIHVPRSHPPFVVRLTPYGFSEESSRQYSLGNTRQRFAGTTIVLLP